MTAFNPAPDLWTAIHDRFGNFYCWQHRDTNELRYLACPPGPPPAMPPGGSTGALQSKIPINPNFNHAVKSPAEIFTPPELAKKGLYHNAPPEVSKTSDGRGSAKPGPKDMRPSPFSPPNNFKHPPSQPKSSAIKAEQWLLQRNKEGEEYYFNTNTLAWQLDTPESLKKYTTC